MYLVFDTETTGLPLSRKAAISDVDNWPRIVQIAWEAFDSVDRKIDSHAYFIRPDGFTIPEGAVRVHGISTSMAAECGLPVAEVLGVFAQMLSQTEVLIGHNLRFDTDVLGAEFHRLGLGDPFRGKTHSCTMLATTRFCGLPGRYGFKWPTLPELHSKLFETTVKESHEAAADVATCSKCFFELKRRGMIKIAKAAPHNRTGVLWDRQVLPS